VECGQIRNFTCTVRVCTELLEDETSEDRGHCHCSNNFQPLMPASSLCPFLHSSPPFSHPESNSCGSAWTSGAGIGARREQIVATIVLVYRYKVAMDDRAVPCAAASSLFPCHKVGALLRPVLALTSCSFSPHCSSVLIARVCLFRDPNGCESSLPF
jgi:hypothetical protein